MNNMVKHSQRQITDIETDNGKNDMTLQQYNDPNISYPQINTLKTCKSITVKFTISEQTNRNHLTAQKSDWSRRNT